MSSELQEWDYRENPMPTKAALRWLAIAMIIQAGFGLLQIAFGRVDLVRLMSEGSNKQSYSLVIAYFVVVQISFISAGLLSGAFSIVVYLEVVCRININAKAMAGDKVSLAPKWAVVSYLIPVGNLFLPYINLQQVWRVGRRAGQGTEARYGWYLISVFWAVLLVEHFALILSYRTPFVGFIHRASAIELLGRSLMVLNCFLAWAVLYRCDQRLRARLVADETYGGYHLLGK